MNEDTEIKSEVGIVIGTKESTPFEFWFQVSEDNPVFVDDIVKVINYVNGVGKIEFYGIITNIIKGFEGLEFHSWNKEVQKGRIPYQKYHIAYVNITRIEPEKSLTPPEPGSKVYKVFNENETKKAINMENHQNLLPAGILKNGEPAYINWDFINGKKGAHISISGISGIATKTSYALFLIHSMMYCKSIKDSEKRNIKAIIFSVKGEDLLHIDKKSLNCKDKKSEEAFKKLGIEFKPFSKKDIEFYAPPKSENPEEALTEEVSEKDKLKVYRWSIKDFFMEGLCEYMFDQEEKEDDNFTYVLNYFSNSMKKLAQRSPENRVEIEVTLDNRKINLNITSLYGEEVNIISSKEPTVEVPLSQLLNLSGYENDETGKLSEQLKKVFFPSRAPSQTISKFIRKFLVSAKDISFMVVNKDSKKVIPEKKISVVSISDKFLSFRAQRFVVGSILSDLYFGRKRSEEKETVFIMIDELNKYAPSTGYSPIKNILLDIAERGRSLGIILIGAQQMASEVEPRIISNSSIKVIGRTDSGEIENKVYKYLPTEFKEKAKKIKSGTMILFQPDIEVPIVITFPKPPYATRKEEIYVEEEDLKSIDNKFST